MEWPVEVLEVKQRARLAELHKDGAVHPGVGVEGVIGGDRVSGCCK
jgi:hypothetical protein